MGDSYRDGAYTHEKLGQLVHHFAVDDGDLKARFRRARHLISGRVELNDFPADQRDDAATLIDAVLNWETKTHDDFAKAIDLLLCLEDDARDFVRGTGH